MVVNIFTEGICSMYTKGQQTSQNKNKKPSMKNKSKITQEEKEYLNWLQCQDYSCFVCGTFSRIEWHHVKLKSTDKKRHNRLIPLCFNHHHGRELSPHGNAKRWRQKYNMFEQNEKASYIFNDFLKERLLND